jgi:SAM-dependent methyltransferase
MTEPSDWILRYAGLLSPGASVLDVAAGQGRHARWLAARGCRVTAIDRAPEALTSLRSIAGLTVIEADIEADRADAWPVPPGSFDALVVTHYLHRPLFPRMAASLRPGGYLLYETFMVGNERYGRPSSPAFLLRESELLAAFATLRVIAFEQGVRPGPSPRVVQRLLACAPGGSLELPSLASGQIL